MITCLSPQCTHSDGPTHHLLQQNGCRLISALRARTLPWTRLLYFGSLLVNPCLYSQVLWTPRLSYCPAGPQHPPPPLTFISEQDQDQRLNLMWFDIPMGSLMETRDISKGRAKGDSAQTKDIVHLHLKRIQGVV